MRLWDRVLSRADPGYNEYMYSGAYAVSTLDSQGRGREGADAGLVRTARDAYTANGIVFACVAVRMALFSEARFKFQNLIDKHLFVTPDLATELALLEYPWPNADTGELLSRMEQDDSTSGQAYIRRVEPADGGDPLLVQMRPDTVTIVSEEVADSRGRVFRRPSGYVEDLRVAGIERDPQFYNADEVAHFSPVPDPKASFRGMSWLTPVIREVAGDQAMTTYKIAHLGNGAMPGLVLKYSQKLSDQTVEKLRKRLSARYGGPENAGKTIVLDEGADMTVAGSTLEQLQFDLVAKAGERRIAAVAQVPLEVLGLAQGDYQAAIRRMADLWARPHWRQACASLQHLLNGVTAPSRLWYDVSDIAALREGELQRGQTVLVKSQAVGAFVTAGYTRESAIAAADSGDLSQLVPEPAAAPPGAPTGVRAPQAGVPQDLPGVGHPNVPNAKPGQFAPMPGMPNGARG